MSASSSDYGQLTITFYRGGRVERSIVHGTPVEEPPEQESGNQHCPGVGVDCVTWPAAAGALHTPFSLKDLQCDAWYSGAAMTDLIRLGYRSSIDEIASSAAAAVDDHLYLKPEDDIPF